MSVLSKDEIMQRVNAIIGDTPTDENLTFIEDISDTFDSFGNAPSELERVRKEAEENDAAWRKKYRDRFFNGPSEEDETIISDDGGSQKKPKTYESLFTVKED